MPSGAACHVKNLIAHQAHSEDETTDALLLESQSSLLITAGIAGMSERVAEDRQGLVASSGRLLNVHQAICVLQRTYTWHIQAQQVQHLLFL